MKLLYDHQIFGMQKFGGISRYFVELMSRLPEGIKFANTIVFSDNVYLKDADSRFTKGLSLPEFLGRNKVKGPLNRLRSDLAIKDNKFDLFHPTYYNPYFLKKLKRPYVITVYDMIHEKFSHMFSAGDPTKDFKRESIVNADRVISISNNTKADLIEIYGLPEEKIDVVHLGHSVDNCQAMRVENIPENYILFVGQRGGYKNFERFIKAFEILKRKEPDIELICTGSEFHKEELSMLHLLGIEKSVRHCFVTDSQLTYLYQNALCFVYPSLYEGFGIPILEAFAAGCPLALSNTSCFPEIAKTGGVYFDPYQIDSIADVLEKVVRDEGLRAELRQEGKKVLSSYSWDKMAEETAVIYKKTVC